MKNLSARVLRALYQSIFIYTKMKNLEKMNNSGGRALHALYEWGFIAKKKSYWIFFCYSAHYYAWVRYIFYPPVPKMTKIGIYLYTNEKFRRTRATCALSINPYIIIQKWKNIWAYVNSKIIYNPNMPYTFRKISYTEEDR